MRKISPTGRRRVNRLIRAAKDYAFIGSSHPDAWGEIEDNMNEAKALIIDYIAMLEETNDRLQREAHGG